MVPAEQMHGALKSIQALIAQARHDACSAGANELGDLLDDMELLPDMLGESDDRSREFRDVLDGIAQKHEHCRYIVEQFLGPAAGTSGR